MKSLKCPSLIVLAFVASAASAQSHYYLAPASQFVPPSAASRGVSLGAINNVGAVAGIYYPSASGSYRGFVSQNGVVADLPSVGGTFPGPAKAMNDSGAVVGWGGGARISPRAEPPSSSRAPRCRGTATLSSTT